MGVVTWRNSMVKVLGNYKSVFFDVIDLEEQDNNNLFPPLNLSNATEFTGKYRADDDECYYIALEASDTFMDDYVGIFDNLINTNSVSKDDLRQMTCLLCKKDEALYFQKVYGKNVIKRPFFYFDGSTCSYEEGKDVISLTMTTDIYFDISSKKIYFHDFSKAKSIIKKLEKFYREATENEIAEFFGKEHLSLMEGIKIQGVTARKKIAQMLDDHIFDNATEEHITKWNKYAKKYKKAFPSVDGRSISISSPKDIDFLYDAVYENYYTTDITKQKRRTNSWKKM